MKKTKTSKKIRNRIKNKKINKEIETKYSSLNHLYKRFDREIGKEKPRGKVLNKFFKELYVFATKDPLTGAFNRYCLNDILFREMKRSLRHDLCLSIIILDIDNFKKYNDAFGHLQGDEALKKITKIIILMTRKEDFIARYGGEEFIVVLPETRVKEAREVAERIRKKVQESKIKKITKKVKKGYDKITVSMGIAQLTKKGIKDMVIRADNALYKAKSQGKNKICISKIKIKNK